jgi:hypothetical protein
VSGDSDKLHSGELRHEQLYDYIEEYKMDKECGNNVEDERIW